MEKADLAKLLKGHEGERFWCSLYGECTLLYVNEGDAYPIGMDAEHGPRFGLTREGNYCKGEWGECILFPSKELRDWGVWQKGMPMTFDELMGSGFAGKGAFLSFLAKEKARLLIRECYGGMPGRGEPKVSIVLDESQGLKIACGKGCRKTLCFRSYEQARLFMARSENIGLAREALSCK